MYGCLNIEARIPLLILESHLFPFSHIDFFPFPCMQFGCIEDSPPHVLLYFGDVSIPAATHVVEICRDGDINEFNLEKLTTCRHVENVEFLRSLAAEGD